MSIELDRLTVGNEFRFTLTSRITQDYNGIKILAKIIDYGDDLDDLC
jgi:hypothetical protein